MSRVTILAVDDLRTNLFLLKAELESHGFEVLTATSGYLAMEMLDEHDIDPIVSDQEMPGMERHGICESRKSPIR